MSREEIEKLMGGYATGTLTPAEREALFAAALEDQQLFEALAREEPLRELLQDPAARTRLQAALERRPEPGYLRWLRPAAWAIPAVGLAAIVVVFVMQREAPRTVLIAQAPALPRVGPVEPVPSPLPQNLEKRERPLMAQALKAVPIDSLADNAAPAAPSAKDAAEPLAEPKPVPATAAVSDQALRAVPPPPPPPAAPVAAPPPPPRQAVPAPISPPSAAQQVVIVEPPAQQGQQGQQSSNGVRLEAAQVQVQAEVGGFVQATDARALFFGQADVPVVRNNLVDAEQLARRKAAAAAAPVARVNMPVSRQIGVRYSIQRQLATGTASVIPNEVLDAGDRIALKLEPNEAGYLSVFERAAGAWREIGSTRLERLTSYTVPAQGSLGFDTTGRIELFVVLSREARPTPYPVPEARLDQVTSVNFPERLTYVVSTASVAQGQTVAFPITLTHK